MENPRVEQEPSPEGEKDEELGLLRDMMLRARREGKEPQVPDEQLRSNDQLQQDESNFVIVRLKPTARTVVALIGNKADMPAGRHEVAAAEAARLAEEQGLFFSEASALTGDNVERAILALLEEVFTIVSRRALELDEARRMRGDQQVDADSGGGEVLSLKGTVVDVGSIMETSAM